MHSSSVTRAPKSQLGDEQPSIGGLWNLPKNIQTEGKKKKNAMSKNTEEATVRW